MMSLVVVIGLVAACSASPSLYYGGIPVAHYYGGYYPSAVVSPIKSQYHTQNELGQYAYGYNDGYSSKAETKHANGLTEGSYSYVDPNGVLQQYKYESDENGYRVSGTNLPTAPAAPVAPVAAAPVATGEMPQPVQDTPEVAAAKVAHQIAYDEAKKAADASPDDGSSSGSSDDSSDNSVSVESPAVQVTKAVVPSVAAPAHAYGYAAYGAYPSYAYAAAPIASYSYAAPSPVTSYAYTAPAPVASYAYSPYAVGAYAPVHSQYHSQDEFGQYSYGYNSGSSSKSETKTLDGVTRGGYSYVDPNGHLQQYQYVSDPVNGFRVSGTNLPSNSL